MSKIGDKIAQIALARLGEGEEPPGSNLGPLPEKALKFVGCAAPNPWCAAFACLCVHDALFALKLPDNGPRTASTSVLHAWGEQKGLIIDAAAVQPGDLGLVKGGPTGYHHTVVVTAVSAVSVTTCEGNYGDAVRKNVRLKSELAFVRPYRA